MSDAQKPSAESDVFIRLYQWAKSALNRFWVFRGFIGTLAILAVLAEYLDLSQWQVARAIHAFFASWNGLMGAIGTWLATVLPIAPLAPATVNVIVIVLSTAIPGVYAMVRSLPNKPPSQAKKRAIVVLWLTPWAYLLAIGYWGAALHIEVLAILLSAPMIFMSIDLLETYRRGAIYALACLAAIEIVYWLPYVGSYVDAWATGVLGEDRSAG